MTSVLDKWYESKASTKFKVVFTNLVILFLLFVFLNPYFPSNRHFWFQSTDMKVIFYFLHISWLILFLYYVSHAIHNHLHNTNFEDKTNPRRHAYFATLAILIIFHATFTIMIYWGYRDITNNHTKSFLDIY